MQQNYADSKPKTLSGMENKSWTHYPYISKEIPCPLPVALDDLNDQDKLYLIFVNFAQVCDVYLEG